MIECVRRLVRAPPTQEDAAILAHVSKSTLQAERGDAEYIYCRVEAAISTGERFCLDKFQVRLDRCANCNQFVTCKHL